MKKHFSTFVKIALISVYLIIIAGATVRMTGSGMGCPDWPKCFGYIIPPTDVKQLLWKQNHWYEDGKVIIKDEKLLVATGNFKTETLFEEAYWRPYTKHDYAIFNATETWIEYINRLVGALSGVIVFLMAVWSFWWWKTDKKVTILSWLTAFLMGVQGWLGAKVVYSVLNPVKITIHMVVALIIVAILIYILRIINPKSESIDIQVYAIGASIGMVLGATQSLSRSTYSKLLPDTEDHTTFFSFFDVTEKVAIVLGTFIFVLVGAISESLKNVNHP